MNEILYKIRKTNSGSYSIDKYEKGEFKETISQNNLFEESNENQLNEFGLEIIKEYKKENNKDISGFLFIEKLKEKYNDFYGFENFSEEELDLFGGLDEIDFKSDNQKEVVISLLRGYKEEYDSGGGYEIAEVFLIEKDFYRGYMSIDEINDLLLNGTLVETGKKTKIKYNKEEEIIFLGGEEKDFNVLVIKIKK